MLPGFLHLDLRRGCTADMLVSSLSMLMGSTDAFESIFTVLGMPEIRVVVVKDAVNGLKGHVVQFYVNDVKIQRTINHAIKTASPKISPKRTSTRGAYNCFTHQSRIFERRSAPNFLAQKACS